MQRRVVLARLKGVTMETFFMLLRLRLHGPFHLDMLNLKPEQH